MKYGGATNRLYEAAVNVQTVRLIYLVFIFGTNLFISLEAFENTINRQRIAGTSHYCKKIHCPKNYRGEMMQINESIIVVTLLMHCMIHVLCKQEMTLQEMLPDDRNGCKSTGTTR